MNTIAYYISDYGYGHAARSVALIRELLKLDQSLTIFICHSFARTFLKNSLPSNRVFYRNINTDVGYFLIEDSIEPDQERLTKEYKQFVNRMPFLIKNEEDFLLTNRVDLVLSDISPLAFEAANNLNIPSIGISNFTWYTAYKGLINESLLTVFKEAYQKMDFFFSLAGSNEELNEETKVYPFGFFARSSEPNEVERIKMLVNPTGKMKIIFVGLGMKIGKLPLESLPLWNSQNVVFLVSSNVDIHRGNVYKIPKDYTESQNFIAASDLLISKAGWGMISEAVTNNVPLLLLNRKSMKEDQNTIHYVKSNYGCQLVEWEEFINMKEMDLNVLHLKDGHQTENQAASIARQIIKILDDLKHK